MIDLYAGFAILFPLSALLGVLAWRLLRRRSRVTGALVLLVVSVALVFDVAYWRNGLWPAHVLPFSNMIVLANLEVPLAAVLIGAAAGLMPGSAGRRSVLLVPLAALAVWSCVAPCFDPQPEVSNRWRGRVCRQTSSATCSPAAAATLLAAHGIRSTEGEMARLCLTNAGGTPIRGLYRGLKLKTAGTPFDVRPVAGDLDALHERLADGPVILTVKLIPAPGVDPRFERDWGWVPGVSHAVVLFGRRADGLYDVGDPSVGRERWDKRALDTLWHGEAIQLVPAKIK